MTIMTIAFRCLICGESLEVDDAQSGGQTECSKCGAEVLVPAASASSSAPVLHRGVSAVGARSRAAKSVFRSKRKAQNRAEAAGEEFDGGDFVDQRHWKVLLGFVVSVIVIFVVYVGYLAIPPSRVPLTDAEATAIMRDVQSTDWGTYLGGMCDAVDKLNDVMVYVRNEATYEEVFPDLKKLNDIIQLQPVAKEEDMEDMEDMEGREEREGRGRMLIHNRQIVGNRNMLKHLERLRDSNPKLARRISNDISVFKAVTQ
jgi:DNA-directed RNA polymerase subunit RPC12/RpoP